MAGCKVFCNGRSSPPSTDSGTTDSTGSIGANHWPGALLHPTDEVLEARPPAALVRAERCPAIGGTDSFIERELILSAGSDHECLRKTAKFGRIWEGDAQG